MDRRRLRLTAGELSAEIAPDTGGAIARLQAGDHSLLRPELQTGPHVGSALGMACFPMVPFANRIDRGRFEHAGHEVVIPCNVAEPHPLHGHGWQSAWTVDHHDGCSARLLIRSGGTDWPWPYEAFQEFLLAADTLTVTLGLRNRAAERFPVSLGLHPYFAGGGALLQAKCRRMWARNDEGIPTAPGLIPEAWDFSTARPVCGTGLDHCFDGWSGHATVRWPTWHMALHLEAEGCGFLQVYAPAGEDYFCVEPVTARPDAFNPRPSDRTGPLVVEPGRAVQIRMRLRVEHERQQ